MRITASKQAVRNKQDCASEEPGAGEAIKFEDSVYDAGCRRIPRGGLELVDMQRARTQEPPRKSSSTVAIRAS